MGNIDPFLCTHGFYAFAGVNGETYEIHSVDPWFDIRLGGFERFTNLKNRNPDFKPLISLGMTFFLLCVRDWSH